jgi:hypothetical protein
MPGSNSELVHFSQRAYKVVRLSHLFLLAQQLTFSFVFSENALHWVGEAEIGNFRQWGW